MSNQSTPMTPTDREMAVSIFSAYVNDRQREAIEKNIRFVYYTSGETALKIIQNKEIWMRNVTCMKDYAEVKYGVECLRTAYVSEAGKEFKHSLDNLYEGFSGRFEKLFDSWLPHFSFDTFITCVSEHDEDEDSYGRLSMWRAYGGTSSVAIVMNNTALTSPSDALGAYTYPVAYWSAQDIIDQFQAATARVIENADLIRRMGSNSVTGHVFEMFKYAALCVKHPGFKEEREWRVIYTPSIKVSRRLVKQVESINGTPQVIYKIPLKNVPEENFVGADQAELIEKIIIGPTQYPAAIAHAFAHQLQEIGMSNAGDKIVVSDIPLRI